MEKKSSSSRFFSRRFYLLTIGVIVVILIAMGLARKTITKADQEQSVDFPTFAAQRGPLLISVMESGTIKARDQVILKSEVEGRRSIIFLIPEGTRVKQGELLVELDGSKLMDDKVDQQIRVQNADAAFVSARENFEVIKNQAQSDVDKAQLTFDFAKDDLKKYLEGEYPNQLKEVESRLTLANEDVTRAKETFEWSKKLFKDKYISQTELDADELAMKKKILDRELTQNNLDLLQNFTHKRKLAQLESDVKQSQMALERAVRKAKADVVQAEANMEAKKAEFERQQTKLSKIETQIVKTKIYAPAEGLVIYATSAQSGGGPRMTSEPLQEGKDVQERQDLIYLPTTTSAKVEVAIHESNLDKIRIGLPVRISVDALPDQMFTGKVQKIAPLPDARSAFMNPDLKVYNTDIYLDNNSESLRSGMSCKAEIIVEEHNEATYIPVQAVLRVAGKTTVYVVNDKGLEPRNVEIGLDNNRMVRIIKGLDAGEVVSLTPPLSAAATEPATGEGGSPQGGKRTSEKGVTSSKGGVTPPKAVMKETSAAPAPAPSSLPPSSIKEGSQKDVVERRGPEQQPPPTEVGRQPGQGEPGGSGGPRSPGQGNLTPEQQRMRDAIQKMTPEEREKLQNATPEERRKMRERFMGQAQPGAK